jgi:dTDP-4-dehydrorhamnose 3,5-epimerase
MRFHPTALSGVMLIAPSPVSDDRGHFARLYCPNEFARAGIDFAPTQTSLSFNRARHTLRGMHFCLEPEAKLVRCTRGRIFDVAVDIRRDSTTFRRWFGV